MRLLIKNLAKLTEVYVHRTVCRQIFSSSRNLSLQPYTKEVSKSRNLSSQPYIKEVPKSRNLLLQPDIKKVPKSRNLSLQPDIKKVTKSRNLSLQPDIKKVPKQGITKEKEKLRTYIVKRYMEYVSNYSKALQNRFPTAMRMYRVFSIGIKDFYGDLKIYIAIRMKISKDNGFKKITRKELELYHKMPSDMWRIAPVLILSVLPFGNYIIFPLALMKPRLLLCSHFWSIQQKAEFSVQDLKDRLYYNKPVFRALQAKMSSIPDLILKTKWRVVIAKLGSGVHPSVDEVLSCKQLFTNGPYSLNKLSFHQMGLILRMHGLWKGIFRLKNLEYRALMLKEMDEAIIREGGVDSLTTESLRNACLIRGLNTSHLTNQDMIDFLDKWIIISRSISKENCSLLLHCPVLLAYNHPQNWMLIYQ